MEVPSDPRRYFRKSLRAGGYDYTQAGAYFVTICTYNRVCLFGKIIEDEMQINEYGRIVWEEWQRTPQIRQEIALDVFVVMPNHVHGVVFITDDGCKGRVTQQSVGRPPVGGRPPVAPTGPARRSLGSWVAGFKSAVTRRVNVLRGTHAIPLWQRNYYERVLRNEDELNSLREYITHNPARWAEDRERPPYP